MVAKIGIPVIIFNGSEFLNAWGSNLESAPTVLRNVTVTWGRSNVLEKNNPTTCTFDVLDSTGWWAAKLRQGELQKEVTVMVTARDNTTDKTATAQLARGWVAAVETTPTTKRDTTGRRYWNHHVTVVDVTNILGNAVIPSGGLSVAGDTLVDMAKVLVKYFGKIPNLEGKKVVNIFYLSRPNSPGWNIKADGKVTLLECIDAIMSADNCLGWYFDNTPAGQVNIRPFVPRGYSRIAVQKTEHGAYVTPLAGSGAAANAAGIAGARLNEATVTTSDSARVSIVSAGDGESKQTRFIASSNAPVEWTVTAKKLTDGTILTSMVDKLDTVARTPMVAMPAHPSFTVGPTRELPTLRDFNAMFHQRTDALFYLNGSAFSELLFEEYDGKPPICFPVGGTITYDAELGYSFQFNTAWTPTLATTPQESLQTWASAGASDGWAYNTTFGPTGQNYSGAMHPAVTWRDLSPVTEKGLTQQ